MRKTKPDVEKLISKTNADIASIDQALRRLLVTLREVEATIASAQARRDELEKFAGHAPTWLSTGEITLEQFAENGQSIDLVTAEIDRFSDLHDGTSELMSSQEQNRAELVNRLANLKEMLMTLEAESLAELIVKKSGTELKQLLAVLGRHTDQPSGAIAGSLLESTFFKGGQMPRAEKSEILKALS